MRVAPRAVQGSQSKQSGKFTSAFRLAGPKGFDRIIRAQSISDGRFKLFFVENQEKNARLGVIVGKRILFRAVERNLVKRCIRESFRQHSIRQLKLDVVVMLRRGRFRKDCGDLSSSLKTLFSRVESRCAEF